jgi:hypothetical protein
MFDRIEMRKVANGFVVTVDQDGEDREYVFSSSRQVLKFIRDFIEGKAG